MRLVLNKCYANIKQFAFKHTRLKRETRVLDLGCGPRGNFWGFSAESYLGLDSNSKLLKRLERRTDGSYKQQDLRRELAFADGYFDYIVSVSFFHHLNDAQAGGLARQMKRVLKKDGRAIICDGVFPDSKMNILGTLLRYFDRGRYVRNSRRFEELFLNEFYIEEKYSFTEKIFAYTVLLLRPKNDGI